MGFKSWVSGNTLAAADLMTYLMNQSVIGCTSGTHPASPTAGMFIYETDTLLAYQYINSTWKPYVPNASRSVGRTTTISLADATWTSVATYDAGTLYNLGDIAYASGVLTVGTAGLYMWSATCTFAATTANHSQGIRMTVNTVPPTYDQGKTYWAVSGTVGASERTAGGLISLAAADACQINLYQGQGSSMTASPRVFSLARVG